MTRPGADSPQWAVVDEGWGRKAVDFATLSELGNCREYVALHHRLGVDAGDRLLDVACGSGLAIELARLRGASCSGIDASARLVAVARDRNPGCDIRVGDMHALPWDPASFDVVTSFRGIWGTTPDAVAGIHRVLRPGGRVGITVWGHLKVSPGAWALAPFRLAAEQHEPRTFQQSEDSGSAARRPDRRGIAAYRTGPAPSIRADRATSRETRSSPSGSIPAPRSPSTRSWLTSRSTGSPPRPAPRPALPTNPRAGWCPARCRSGWSSCHTTSSSPSGPWPNRPTTSCTGPSSTAADTSPDWRSPDLQAADIRDFFHKLQVP